MPATKRAVALGCDGVAIGCELAESMPGVVCAGAAGESRNSEVLVVDNERWVRESAR